MRKYIVVVHDVFRGFDRHQLATLNIDGQLDLRLAQRYRFCLHHNITPQ